MPKTIRSVVVSSRMNHVFFQGALRYVASTYMYVGVAICMVSPHLPRVHQDSSLVV